MKSFLNLVARDLIGKFGTDLSRTVIVFPNKRASLFLNQELMEASGAEAIWSPRYITISDLFRQQTDAVVADKVKLVCELFKVYTSIAKTTETLDEFYSWGELLLSDFDDVDKNMGRAELVFENTAQIHEYDSVEFLTDNQREILKQFFANFQDDHESRLRKNFEELWNKLGTIYAEFRNHLRQSGIAYEGMLYRDVVERGEVNAVGVDRFVFVGFNLLHKVEQELFQLIKRNGIADTHFYWDYDEYYMNTEAGRFIKAYMQAFPNELTDKALFRNFAEPKDVTFVNSSTEDIQARYVSQWLTPERIAAGRRTAIVLCNEALLPTVVNCLPPEVEHVNITTGYPLLNTYVATFVIRKVRRMRGDNVEICDKLMTDIRELSQVTALEQESVYRMYTLISRLRNLVVNDGLEVDNLTFQRLLMQVIRTTTIPFHGEPVVGVQIMGVLETRNLDFDHVLLLSCNEGNIPRGVNDSSFIPHSIRKAYSLTTVENKVSIYAYYFHRLLQRAGDVTVTYNSSTDDGQVGEKSRFMQQLLAESDLDIKIKAFNAPLKASVATRKPIGKSASVMASLNGMQSISPSAVNLYLRCPLQFFYCYVCGIRPDDEEEQTIDNRVFGLIFHRAAELIYKPFLGQTMTESVFEALLKDERKVLDAIDTAIKIELFGVNEQEAINHKMPVLSGSEVIQRSVIRRLLRQLLQFDRKNAPVKVLGVEKKIRHTISFESQGAEREILIKGTIDRLDEVTGPDGKPLVRVVDYKTGNSKQPSIPGIDDVFRPERIESHSDYYLQTLLYSMLVGAEMKRSVSPCLVYPSHALSKDYSPILTFGERNSKAAILDAREYAPDFGVNFRSLLTEIFSPEVPFAPACSPTRCDKCFYRNICGDR